MVDHFDRLPDCILLDILHRVSDAKFLVRCLSVSKRFRSLVPDVSSLRLRVDRVIPISAETYSPLFSFIETVGMFLNLFFPLLPPPSAYSSPSSILRAFRSIRHLDIQLPSSMTLHDGDDGSNPRGAFLRYRAIFGETLEKCVIIMGFRRKEEAGDGQVTKVMDDEEEVKERVFWVIRALVDACKRHDYAARELIGEHQGLARLRMTDAAGEGVVEMDERGLEECRNCVVSHEGFRVPRVRMQMWCGRKMEVVLDGEVFEGTTLVVVRTVKDRTMDTEDGAEVAATEAFGADGYKEAVRALMKSRSYSLEMNSFLI